MPTPDLDQPVIQPLSLTRRQFLKVALFAAIGVWVSRWDFSGKSPPVEVVEQNDDVFEFTTIMRGSLLSTNLDGGVRVANSVIQAPGMSAEIQVPEFTTQIVPDKSLFYFFAYGVIAAFLFFWGIFSRLKGFHKLEKYALSAAAGMAISMATFRTINIYLERLLALARGPSQAKIVTRSFDGSLGFFIDMNRRQMVAQPALGEQLTAESITADEDAPAIRHHIFSLTGTGESSGDTLKTRLHQFLVADPAATRTDFITAAEYTAAPGHPLSTQIGLLAEQLGMSPSRSYGNHLRLSELLNLPANRLQALDRMWDAMYQYSIIHTVPDALLIRDLQGRPLVAAPNTYAATGAITFANAVVTDRPLRPLEAMAFGAKTGYWAARAWPTATPAELAATLLDPVEQQVWHFYLCEPGTCDENAAPNPVHRRLLWLDHASGQVQVYDDPEEAFAALLELARSDPDGLTRISVFRPGWIVRPADDPSLWPTTRDGLPLDHQASFIVAILQGEHIAGFLITDVSLLRFYEPDTIRLSFEALQRSGADLSRMALVKIDEHTAQNVIVAGQPV